LDVGNLDVDILDVGNLGVDILDVGNLDVDIEMLYVPSVSICQVVNMSFLMKVATDFEASLLSRLSGETFHTNNPRPGANTTTLEFTTTTPALK
jgi:hypothetical protein